jgi:hypothetical protein
MTDRSDEQQGAQIPTRGGHRTDRVAVVAKLRPDSSERARAILTEGPRTTRPARRRSASGGPLLDGTPALAREEFYWEASSSS